MRYVEIAGTAIRASTIGLGTWAIGGVEWGGPDDDAAIATIHRALELGITLIDTAPIYGYGHAEEVLGRAIKGRRREVVIATKLGLEWDERGEVRRNACAERIERELEDSLRRLQTDYVDVYQVHWPDTVTPMRETALALDRLLDAGKIRAIGVSNFSSAQMDEFRSFAPLHTVQPPYNLFERDAEKEVLPYAQRQAITALTYSALCRGLLSGRMTEHTTFSGDDLRAGIDPKFQPPRFAQYLRAVSRLDDLAQRKYGKGVIHVALRWVLDRLGAGVALWGARRPDQLEPLPDVAGFTLDEASLAEMDRIVEEEVTDPVDASFLAPP
jgi:aryl-alcohol dehydrogenase-like predicted oxidoreductase